MSPPKKAAPLKANEQATGTASGTKANELVDTMEQSAVLQAIEAMRSELLAKMDKKADIQNDFMRRQISMLREEMQAASEQANIKVNILDERTTSLEAAANTHSDLIA